MKSKDGQQIEEIGVGASQIVLGPHLLILTDYRDSLLQSAEVQFSGIQE